MSKVAFILDEYGANKVDVLKILRAGLGLEMSRIAHSAGTDRPLIINTLFDRSEPTFAERLLPLLEQLEALGASYRAFELLDDEEFSTTDSKKLYQIDSKRLRNMIAARHASIQQQIDLGTLPD